MIPYLPPSREQQIKRLKEEIFDVLVIGGGCVGSGGEDLLRVHFYFFIFYRVCTRYSTSYMYEETRATIVKGNEPFTFLFCFGGIS